MNSLSYSLVKNLCSSVRCRGGRQQTAAKRRKVRSYCLRRQSHVVGDTESLRVKAGAPSILRATSHDAENVIAWKTEPKDGPESGYIDRALAPEDISRNLYLARDL
jgi:hypothetical protein